MTRTRAYNYPSANTAVLQTIADVTATGFEHQDVPIVFNALNGTDWFSIDTAASLTGAACLKHGRSGGSSEAFRYITGVFGSEHIASSSFGLNVTTAPPTSKHTGFHAFNATGVYHGLGIYTDASNVVHLALISGDYTSTPPNVAWKSSNALTVDDGTTWYRVCWKQWRTTSATAATTNWMADVILMNSSGGFIERSGPILIDPVTIQPGALTNPAFGAFSNNATYGGIADPFTYRIDDLMITKGGWAPLYAKVIKQQPTGVATANTQGTDTAWAWAAGGTNNDEFTTVDEVPHDSNTSYIARTTTGNASQTYLLSASGITLGTDEMIFGVSDYACATFIGLVGPSATFVRGRVNGVARNGSGISLTDSVYTWCSGRFSVPIGGWTVAMIDAGEAGITMQGGTTIDRRCTSIVREVAYGLDMYDNGPEWMYEIMTRPQSVEVVPL